MLTYGSLFSGIGGIDLGLDRAGMQCKWQVEIDDYATKVLAKHWPDVARFRDIRDCGSHNLTSVDLICGGFPCQDISVAGKRAGIDGERSGLWREFYRIICELRPHFVFVENVPALLNGGIDRVLGNLAQSGYDAEWQVLSAAQFGAQHLRRRVFIIAYPASTRGQQKYRSLPENASNTQRRATLPSVQSQCSRQNVADATSIGCRSRWPKSERQFGQTRTDSTGTPISNTDRQRLEIGQVFGSYAREELTSFKRGCSEGTGQWATEPDVGRVANGISSRVDRIRTLGNAVVPQIAEYIGNCIVAAVQANQEVIA